MSSEPSGPLPSWPHAVSPFHPGEVFAQAQVGVSERMGEVGRRVIRAEMPAQHRELFEKLPVLWAGALDARGRPWATVFSGKPGFVRTPDAVTLEVAARPLLEGSLSLALAEGSPVGLLGLEAATRRRNRVNGTVLRSHAAGLALRVSQSFGNCPKYIQARVLERASDAVVADPVPFGHRLPPHLAPLLTQADTFFVATATPDAALPGQAEHGGVDVSHRGGRPGFVQLQVEGAASVLTVPDFSGNQFFNTVGNITANPWAGLLFVDWAKGDLVSLLCEAEVLWGGPEVAALTGAQRLLRFRVQEGWWAPAALCWRGGQPEPSPQLAGTGIWQEAPASRG